jgi:hypothetical protein
VVPDVFQLSPAARPQNMATLSTLHPGSDPSVLPGNVLIADKENNRLIEVTPEGKVVWMFPKPGELAHGQTFKIPDDAFFTPGGHQIVATQEDDFVISVIDMPKGRIVYRYGHPGVPGSGPSDRNQAPAAPHPRADGDGRVLRPPAPDPTWISQRRLPAARRRQRRDGDQRRLD